MFDILHPKHHTPFLKAIKEFVKNIMRLYLPPLARVAATIDNT